MHRSTEPAPPGWALHPRFAAHVATLDGSFQALMAMAPVTFDSLPRGLPPSGIYVFSEGDRHLYVGRSRNLRRRLSRHCSAGATHRGAAFAFRLAREETGRLSASYRPEGSRVALARDTAFGVAFEAAKTRIRAMSIRFVGEADPVRQALLEVYAAVALQTPYNSFDTH